MISSQIKDYSILPSFTKYSSSHKPCCCFASHLGLTSAFVSIYRNPSNVHYFQRLHFSYPLSNARLVSQVRFTVFVFEIVVVSLVYNLLNPSIRMQFPQQPHKLETYNLFQADLIDLFSLHQLMKVSQSSTSKYNPLSISITNLSQELLFTFTSKRFSNLISQSSFNLIQYNHPSFPFLGSRFSYSTSSPSLSELLSSVDQTSSYDSLFTPHLPSSPFSPVLVSSLFSL